MRIRRLDLTRYGKFTDQVIDFGPAPAEGPDFHILFGLNEAGKSTTLNAILDLLYGIEERSRYAFLHDYAAMRIGGVLEIDGAEQQFIRIKQRSHSLLDAAGQPVSEIALNAHLAGLSREAYASMFLLDDDTLEAGGKAILDSRGDLGQLLFAAGAGLAHATGILEGIQAEADGIHRKHAQGTELALLKKQLVELKSQRDAIDTLASSHEALEGELADATRNYERILVERSTLSSRLDSLERCRRTIPMLAELSRRQAQLTDMPAMAYPIFTGTVSISDLIRDDATFASKIQSNDQQIARLEEKILSIVIDEAVVTVSERIRGLSDRKARHVSAGLDLPTRRMELQLIDDAVSASLVALGKPLGEDPVALLLPTATVSLVRSMLEQRSGIVTAIRVAHEEANAAAHALHMAQDRIGEERSVPAPARAKLATAVTKARESGHDRRLRESMEHVDTCTTRWALASARLRPWSGDIVELTTMVLPGAHQINSWKASLADCRARLRVLAERAAELMEDLEAAAASTAALRSATDVPDDDAALRIRRSRDEAWLRHSEVLTRETAEAFAAALEKDDAVGIKRLAGARDLQDIRSATKKLADTEATLNRVQSQRGEAENNLEQLTGAIRTGAGAVAALWPEPASPERDLEALELFILARSAAMEAWDALELARTRISGAIREGGMLVTELVLAAKRVGLAVDDGESMEATMSAAESFLDRQASLDAHVGEAQRAIAARSEDLTARKRAVAAAEGREKTWMDNMTEALAGTWLNSAVSFAALGGVLDQLAVLGKDLQDREALRRRVSKMEADREVFLAEVSAVAATCGEPMDPEAPEQVAVRLAARLERAEKSIEACVEITAELDSLRQEREDLSAELAMHERRKGEMLRVYGVASLEEVVRQDELLKERDRVLVAATELERQVLSELGSPDIQSARAMLEGVEVEALEIETTELRQRLEDAQQALQQQVVRQARAADKLDAVGSDSAIARIDARRRTVLLEIEERATQFLRLKLGALAAESAMRDYRERHRSGMMQHASDAFAMMTRGFYTGLSSQPSKGGEVLIANQRDGRSKVADALSKGTRFQLYLSLRMAGYQEFARVRPTVPFIADDILETFDHLRSEEVFRLFGGIGKMGQVIYLTHHRHLCDIAKQMVPSTTIHEIA